MLGHIRDKTNAQKNSKLLRVTYDIRVLSLSFLGSDQWKRAKAARGRGTHQRGHLKLCLSLYIHYKC